MAKVWHVEPKRPADALWPVWDSGDIVQGTNDLDEICARAQAAGYELEIKVSAYRQLAPDDPDFELVPPGVRII